MKDVRIISGKRIVPSLDMVSALLGMKNTDQIQTVFEQQLSVVKMRIRPKSAMVIDEFEFSADNHTEVKKVLCVMLTVGDSICSLIGKYTAGNEMLKAMVVDAMADSCLFAFEQQLLPYIRQLCLEEGYGILGRLEITRDVPARFQKTVFAALEAERTLGLSITSGYMLKPEKSMSILFELTQDTTMQCLEHDCEKCADKNCMLKKREVLLTIDKTGLNGADSNGPSFAGFPVKSDETFANVQISCPQGSNLLDILLENKMFLSSYCNGKGTCGKCGVLLKEGSLPITPEDKAAFSEKELYQGMRLSCRAVLRSNITIAVRSHENEVFQTPDIKWDNNEVTDKYNSDYGIAIDIGTTTLAFSLIDLSGKRVIDSYTAVNAQRCFGADVLTRIQAANAGKGRQLSCLIKHDILIGIKTLITRNAIKPAQLRHIVIAANTVMLHLLRGYSCEGLSGYPFTPVTLDMEELTLSELFSDFWEDALQIFPLERVNVILLPGISAFVGADITAGLYACNILEKEAPILFLDLGTNGEMALKRGNVIYTASTAAGPAFEAGNIKWGMPGIAGAISQVTFCGGRAKIKTIEDCLPKGICGTGVIEAIAELLIAGLIDTNGKLREPYFPAGFPLAQTAYGEQILLYQQDIREIQMAKAAIRAGIEILLQRSNTYWEEIGAVYLAGGFGFFLDTKKASYIGILPNKMPLKIIAAGNTSLKGAQLYLSNPDRDVLQEIKKNAREISLAQDSSFQELYLKNMAFDDITV